MQELPHDKELRAEAELLLALAYRMVSTSHDAVVAAVSKLESQGGRNGCCEPSLMPSPNGLAGTPSGAYVAKSFSM